MPSSRASFPSGCQVVLMDRYSWEIIAGVEDCSIQSTISLYPKVSNLVVKGLHCEIKKNRKLAITLLGNWMLQWCFCRPWKALEAFSSYFHLQRGIFIILLFQTPVSVQNPVWPLCQVVTKQIHAQKRNSIYKVIAWSIKWHPYWFLCISNGLTDVFHSISKFQHHGNTTRC